jgi:hypothetical protein
VHQSPLEKSPHLGVALAWITVRVEDLGFGSLGLEDQLQLKKTPRLGISMVFDLGFGVYDLGFGVYIVEVSN